jgi:hypothetical protein
VRNFPPQAAEYFDDDQEAADCFAMSELTPDQFEEVLAEARVQEDLSRENVARLSHECTTEQKTIGRDGKTYPKPSRPAPKPRRKSIVDEMGTAVFQLDKDVRRIMRLVDDDRFARNRSELDARNRGDLLRLVDCLDDAVFNLSRFRRGDHDDELYKRGDGR